VGEVIPLKATGTVGHQGRDPVPRFPAGRHGTFAAAEA
jgi:hypothetical protein